MYHSVSTQDNIRIGFLDIPLYISIALEGFRLERLKGCSLLSNTAKLP